MFSQIDATFLANSTNELGDHLDDMVELRCVCVLAMRLVRHILRERGENKMLALPLVPKLLNLLPCGIGSSDSLTELFANNAMVDRVPDSTIMMFIELIRTKTRHQRYIRFLETLCSSHGKAVRPNQWRIARMLLEEAPDLLLHLRLEPAKGCVASSGSQRRHFAIHTHMITLSIPLYISSSLTLSHVFGLAGHRARRNGSWSKVMAATSPSLPAGRWSSTSG